MDQGKKVNLALSQAIKVDIFYRLTNIKIAKHQHYSFFLPSPTFWDMFRGHHCSSMRLESTLQYSQPPFRSWLLQKWWGRRLCWFMIKDTLEMRYSFCFGVSRKYTHLIRRASRSMTLRSAPTASARSICALIRLSKAQHIYPSSWCQTDFINHQEVPTCYPRPTFSGDFISPYNVNDIHDEVGQFPTVVSC